MLSGSSVEEGEYVVLLHLVVVLLLFISQCIKSYIYYIIIIIICNISSCSSLLDLRILSTALASTFLKDSLAAGFNYQNIGLLKFHFR